MSHAAYETLSFQCPACGLRSFHPRDLEESYCAQCGFEDGQRAVVALTMRTTAEMARDLLWNSRGGLQLLSPEQAVRFATTLHELDRLVAALRA